jgi:hypothetical protein
MNTYRVPLAALALCMLVVGCESISARSDWNPSVDFSRYHTYSWISKSPLVSKPPEVSALAEVRLESAAMSELAQKGYRFVEDPNQADFVVAFTIGAREKLNVTSTPGPGGLGPFIWAAPYYRDIDVRQFTEGRLAIDLFDTKLKVPVWTGFATKSITSSDTRNLGELANKAVAAILKDFPPGAKAAGH